MFFDLCFNLTCLADCFIFLCFEFWVWLQWLRKLGGRNKKERKIMGFVFTGLVNVINGEVKAKGVQFLQGKFHSFHPFATILSYLIKAPLVIKRLFGPHEANFKVMQFLFPLCKMLCLLLVIALVLFTFGSSEGLGWNVASGRF